MSTVHRASLLAVILASLAAAPAMQAADAPSLPTGELMAMVIPDVRALLTHIEGVANAVKPGSVPGGSLADKLGAAIGDPTLALLGPGPVVGVVIPGMPPKSVLFVPSTKPQDLVAAVQGNGMQARVMGAVVAIAKQEDDLSMATPEAYQALCAHPPAADLRMIISPKTIAGTYGMFAQMLLSGLAPKLKQSQNASTPNAAKLMKMLSVECAVALKVMGETDIAQYDVSLGGANIDLDSTLVASPGSALAKAMVAPANDADALAKLRTHMASGPALTRVVGNLPWAALGAYLKDTFAGIPDAKAVLPPAVLDGLDKMLSLPIAGVCSVMSMDEHGAPLNAMAYATPDVAGMKSAMEGFMQEFTSGPGAGSLLGGLESFTFQRDATMLALAPPLPGTPPIDHLAADLLSVTLAPEIKQAAFAMPTTCWMAFAEGTTFECTDTAELVRMIEGGRPPAPLAAESAFTTDHDVLADIDVVALAMAQANVVARARAAEPAAQAAIFKPSGKPPMCISWSSHDGQGRLRMRLAVASIVAAATAVQATRVGGAGSATGPSPQQF